MHYPIHTPEDIPVLPPPKRQQGFATMSAEQKREIASMGGKAAHAQRVAHEFTSEEAKVAGRKGGKISKRKPKVR
jgi:hypothetical protein